MDEKLPADTLVGDVWVLPTGRNWSEVWKRDDSGHDVRRFAQQFDGRRKRIAARVHERLLGKRVGDRIVGRRLGWAMIGSEALRLQFACRDGRERLQDLQRRRNSAYEANLQTKGDREPRFSHKRQSTRHGTVVANTPCGCSTRRPRRGRRPRAPEVRIADQQRRTDESSASTFLGARAACIPQRYRASTRRRCTTGRLPQAARRRTRGTSASVSRRAPHTVGARAPQRQGPWRGSATTPRRPMSDGTGPIPDIGTWTVCRRRRASQATNARM